MTDKSRSNYDRWKPGIKLACMMALKRVCTDPTFYDAVNNKFNSMTWHTVAEYLNKQYPDYAKRFTNINVKDRYDRVLKHHKVFKRMANQLSGFVWNTKKFCFELDDKLIKEYEDNTRAEKFIPSELGIVRFLSKPGQIDLEYYHRFIHQVQNEEELRNDSILNSPSFIEDAINKGILSNLSTRPAIFNNGTQSSQSSSNSSSGASGASSSTVNISKNINNINPNQQSSLPELNSSNSSLSVPTNTSPLSNTLTSNGLLQQTLPQPNLHLGQQQQHPHFPSIPQSQIQQPFGLPQNLLHPNSNPSPQHLQQQNPHTHPQSHDLDFSGFVDNQQGIIGNLPVNLNNNSSDYNANKNELPSGKRLRTGIIQTGLLVENYTSSLSTPTHQSTNSLSQQLPNSHGVARSNSTPEGHQIGIPINQQQGNITPSSGLSTGEAVLQIHKNMEVMENSVIEAVLTLRMNKMISHEDFEKIDELLQDNNGVFIRSAYKRLGNESKLLELINVYLNKLD